MAEQIRDHHELRTWLKDKPREWAQILALRSALRVLPLIGAAPDDAALHLAVFRAMAISWSAHAWSSLDIVAAARAAAHTVARVGGELNYMDAATHAAHAADAAATAIYAPYAADTAHADGTATEAAADAAFHAARAYAAAAYAAKDYAAAANTSATVWSELEQDIRQLERENHLTQNMLFRRPLWNAPFPSTLDESWLQLVQAMRARDPHALVWRDWYRRRLEGSGEGFLSDPVADRALALWLGVQDSHFWDRKLHEVTAEIASWIVGTRESASAQFRREAARLASPDVIVANGLLDIGPNAVVDAPNYGDPFEEVLAILRALLPRLIKAIPGNMHATARACAKGYAEHLEICGLHPIMGLLDDFEFVIREAFRATDPREWNAGFPALMDRYFVRHRELKQLFPHFEEREKLIAGVVVDEDRATGGALVEPVEQGEEAIRQLSEAGLAAPGFAHEGLAQLERSKELAGPAPAASADAKPRLIIRLVGFYEKTVTLLGNMAKLADSPAAKAAAKAAIQTFSDVIEKLLGLLHW